MLSATAFVCGCSDLILGIGLRESPPEMQAAAGGDGTAGAASDVDPRVPLSTACDFDAIMPRAEIHGECDNDGWCWEDPLATGVETHLASLPGAKELWLWSQRALHQQIDGKWIMHVAPTTFDVTGAVVLAPNDIWITTDTLGNLSYDTYLYHFDGSAWTRVQSVEEEFRQLRADPGGALWVIAHNNGSDRVQRFDGRQWQIMAEPAPFAADSNVVEFRPVGADEAWVLHETGVEHIVAGSSLRIDAPEGIRLSAFDRLSDGSVWIAGYEKTGGSLLFQILDSSFNLRASSDIEMITALAGTSGSDVWIGSSTRVDHFDGERFSATHEWHSTFVHELVATDASNLYVLTSNADGAETGTVIHWDGNRWDDADQQLTDIRTVWGAANDDIWVSGASGRFHFDGKTWRKTSDAGDYALWGSATDNIYALGPLGVLRHFDGQTWTVVVEGNSYGPSDLPADHDSLSGDAPNSVWIAAGGVWHYDGAQLTQVSTDVDAVSVQAFSAKDVWVTVGKSQSSFGLLHYDGGPAWQWLGVPALHVWGTSSKNLWIVEDTLDGGGYFMSHFDGATWTKYRPAENTFSAQYPSEYGGNMSRMAGCDDYLWVSEENRINLFDGRQWSTILRGGPARGAIWGRSPNALVVAGQHRGLMRRAR